ncbi:hypothetical protein OY671_009339, partial [Metschnikowia pulcherrima]
RSGAGQGQPAKRQAAAGIRPRHLADRRPRAPRAGHRGRAGGRRPGHAADGGAAARPDLRQLLAARGRSHAAAEADPRRRPARRRARQDAGAPAAARRARHAGGATGRQHAVRLPDRRRRRDLRVSQAPAARQGGSRRHRLVHRRLEQSGPAQPGPEPGSERGGPRRRAERRPARQPGAPDCRRSQGSAHAARLAAAPAALSGRRGGVPFPAPLS